MFFYVEDQCVINLCLSQTDILCTLLKFFTNGKPFVSQGLQEIQDPGQSKGIADSRSQLDSRA